MDWDYSLWKDQWGMASLGKCTKIKSRSQFWNWGEGMRMGGHPVLLMLGLLGQLGCLTLEVLPLGPFVRLVGQVNSSKAWSERPTGPWRVFVSAANTDKYISCLFWITRLSKMSAKPLLIIVLTQNNTLDNCWNCRQTICFGYGFGTICSAQIWKDVIFHKVLRTSEHYVNIRMKELIHRFGSNLLLLRSVIDCFVFLNIYSFSLGFSAVCVEVHCCWVIYGVQGLCRDDHQWLKFLKAQVLWVFHWASLYE